MPCCHPYPSPVFIPEPIFALIYYMPCCHPYPSPVFIPEPIFVLILYALIVVIPIHHQYLYRSQFLFWYYMPCCHPYPSPVFIPEPIFVLVLYALIVVIPTHHQYLYRSQFLFAIIFLFYGCNRNAQCHVRSRAYETRRIVRQNTSNPTLD